MTHIAQRLETLQIFFNALWQSVESPTQVTGSLFTLTLPTKKQSIHIPAPDFIEAIRDDELFDNLGDYVLSLNENQDLRINLALRDAGSIAARDPRVLTPGIHEGSKARGSRNHVSVLPALSAEFDIGQEGHATPEALLPSSWDEVAEHLARCKVPPPSILVRSGRGYHAHWVLASPVYCFVDGQPVGNASALLNQFRSFQARFREGAPFHIDSTAGAEREWRLPGTMNRKIPDKPRPVELVEVNEGVFEIDELAPVTRRRTRDASKRTRSLLTEANSSSEPLNRLKALLAVIDPDDPLHLPTQLLLQGKSFAQHRRHNTMLELSGRATWIACSHKLFEQGLTDDDIVSLFLPAFQVWEDNQTEDDPTSVEREVDKLEGMIETAREKWEDEQEAALTQITVKKQEIVDKLVEVHGEDSPVVAAVIANGSTPLLVRYKNEFYIFNLLKGCYEERWFQKDEVINVARQVWETSPGAADQIITYLSDRGQVKDYTVEKLMEQPLVAGVTARSLRLSVRYEASFYDHKQERFYIAHCPPRPDLQPVYHAEIDEFISVFGADKAELLRDFLAVLLRLDEPCAALYLEGPPGVGKSLFAQGAASLWDRPVTPFENFIGGRRSKFSQLESPLVLLEEGISDTSGITAQFRRFVTEQNTHSVERKGKDPMFLDGCLRLMIAANNPDALTEYGIRHTHSDSLAIMERIAYVKVDERVREWLEEKDRFGNRLRPPEVLNSWIRDGHFANHIAYLAVTREVKRNRLYCAQDEMTPWHVNYLLSTNRVGSYIFEWIARFATEPQEFYIKFGVRRDGDTRVGGGKIVVRSQDVLDGWGAYMSKIQLPSIQDVNYALETLCFRDGLNHHVNLDLLKSYVEKNQIGNWTRIEANVRGLTVVK